MLLANVAWILATNGHRVLTIDWDLEAPGLHRYFQPFLKDKSLAVTDGLMDAITEFVEAALSTNTEEPKNIHSSSANAEPAEASPEPTTSEDPNWYVSYANLLRYAMPLEWKFPGKGRLDFIGPGRQGPSYATKVNHFDWQQFYEKFAGAAFLDSAKRFMAEKYDYVLIDSRTGVSDTSGICTIQMPDVLVVCFTLNNQSIEGARAAAAAAQEQRARSSTLGPLTIVPVPSRVELYESDKVELGRELARVRFRSLVPIDSSREGDQEKYLQQYWGNIEVPYVPKYAYEELLACFGDMPHVKTSILSPAEQIASVIRGEPTELVPPGDEERAAVLLQFARKPYIVTTAEEFVCELPRSEQEAARRLFTRLAQVGSTKSPRTPDVPSIASVNELPEDALRIINKAAEAKLVTMAGEGEDKRVVLADNRLVSAWPRYAEWLDSDREFLVWRQQLDRLLHTWKSSRKDPEDLLTGTSLMEASKWLLPRLDELTGPERAFIEASKNADHEVRLAAAETDASPALARRLQSEDWNARQRLEARSLELEAITQRTSARLRIAVGVTILVSILGVGIYFSHVLRFQRQPESGSQSNGSMPQPSSTNSEQLPPIGQRLQNEARRKEANVLVSLGVVSSFEAASKVDPLAGILGIDNLLAKARSKDPGSIPVIQASRIEYLKISEPLFDSSPGLRNYVCGHNSFVIVASEKVDQAANALKWWRKEYPLAEIGPATTANPDWVPVIVNSFLTCNDARQEAQAIQRKHGKQFGWSPSQGSYSLPECTPCSPVP